MPWNYYVLNIDKNSEPPPDEWSEIIKLVKENKLTEDKLINKIEVAAFSIRGVRTLRWLIDKTHSEYSSKDECLKIGKKLLTYYFNLKDYEKKIPKELFEKLEMDKIKEPTKCPLCLLELEKEMFNKDGRVDSNSIQMGHISPLKLRTGDDSNHFAENINWQHRRCNYMQGEGTLDDALEFMIDILKRHGKIA